MDRISNYDYELPQELVAAEPLPERDQSRLLVVYRNTGELQHRRIADLPELLQPGDCLVLNDTRVVPARLFGRRVATGGKWEGLFLEQTSDGLWKLIGQTRGRLTPGEWIAVRRAHGGDEEDELLLELMNQDAEGTWTARVSSDASAVELLERFGTMPLPPYIHRPLATDADWKRYQTTYAERPGAVAAPTAGLHFTSQLLESCDRRGIERVFVTLHVGIGTFRPIAVENLSEHRMHAEWCELSHDAAARLNAARRASGRIVAVGTTSVRTLESAVRSREFVPFQGRTDLFIRPPYEFRGVDCLLTNFHLPKSTLLVLVSAFAGTELVQRAYAAAVHERYRLYSYGDAMLIL